MTFLDNIEQIILLYPIIAFGAVFLAGIVSSASPCVLCHYSPGSRVRWGICGWGP